jgi:hypothetical protein
MRKILAVLTLLVAALAVASGAQAAPLRTLKPHLLSVQAAWAQRVDATTLAWSGGRVGSGIALLGDTGAARTVAAPAGCAGAAAGSGHLLFDCPIADTGGKRFRAVVTAPDGTVQAQPEWVLPLQGDRGAGRATAIGDQWLHQSSDCLHCRTTPIDYNWRTGAVRAPDPATEMEDLDAPALTTALCRPLAVTPAEPAEDGPAVLGVQRAGAWVLLQRYAGSDHRAVTWDLRRCGSSKAYKLPAGRQAVGLVDGWAVLTPARRLDGAHGLELLRLRDGRRFAVGGTFSGNSRFVATARRLLIDGDSVSNSALWSVALPRK